MLLKALYSSLFNAHCGAAPSIHTLFRQVHSSSTNQSYYSTENSPTMLSTPMCFLSALVAAAALLPSLALADDPCKWYTVQAGDTCYGLAAKANLPLEL